MGTRSLTVVREQRNDKLKEICVMYRQYDGYLEGHGKELADFLAPIKVVNGIPMNERQTILANGADCLAAQIVAHFKKGVGDIYLHPAGTRDVWEEYVYFVDVLPAQGGNKIKGSIRLLVKNTYHEGNKAIEFEGTPEELLIKLQKQPA